MFTTRRSAIGFTPIRKVRAALVAALTLFLFGCGGTLQKSSGTLPNNNNTNNSGGGGTNPLTPGSMVDDLPSFTPGTSGSAKNLDQSNLSNNQGIGFPLLGDVLASGLFMTPKSQGLSLNIEMGGYFVQGGRLISPFNTQSLANFGVSFPDTYVGGEIEIVPGTDSVGEFIGRHHDPNGTRHCLTACQVGWINGAIRARIQSDYGGTSTTLGEVFVNNPRNVVECVNFKDTIAMYINGLLAIAARDPRPVARQSLFGIGGRNAAFLSLSAANMQAVRDANRVAFYETGFDLPSGLLPIQWAVTQGTMTSGGGRAFSAGTGVAVLRQVSVADIDVRMDYGLTPGGSRAGIVFRSGSSGGYRAEINAGTGTVALYRDTNNSSTAISGPYPIPFAPSGTLRVTAQGPQLRVYVNNQVFAAAQDSHFGQGTMGIVLQNASADKFRWESYY